MVHTIDAVARRRVLADAVWTLLRRGGLEAASVRAVATEAGLSTGSVRHFFATQDELHVFAMEELVDRVTARVEEVLATPPDLTDAADAQERARQHVLAGLRVLLPTTDETTADFLAHLQFIAKAMVHEPLAATATRSLDELQDFYRRCVDYLALHGAAPRGSDLDAEARRLAVVMEGLVLRRLTAPHLLDRDQMLAILDAHLRDLLPHTCDGPRQETR